MNQISRPVKQGGFLCFFIFAVTAGLYGQSITPQMGIIAIRQAYYEDIAGSGYDAEKKDWFIRVKKTEPAGESDTLYWTGGRLLPASKLREQTKYRNQFYRYPRTVTDPAVFTEEEIQRVTAFGSTDNRRNSPITDPTFYDLLYNSATLTQVQKNITDISFLGKTIPVHKKIIEPLRRVEQRIRTLAKNNSEVQKFLDDISVLYGFSWREVRDTSSRSLHSFGIAIDILPRGYGQKIIYWNWEKNNGNNRWMLIPLKDRWLPPQAVISAFESEGFIWGGKWGIWDNMHFEYRPELLILQVLSASS
ncbi:MAG: M15 family metallopeptidase [Lachnoclostridium sp.]|jgi:hypothetical protein|nr:M15 family metallopeptidase [Lachnoclostridium sp.]